jgi:hypothetical protein
MQRRSSLHARLRTHARMAGPTVMGYGVWSNVGSQVTSASGHVLSGCTVLPAAVGFVDVA